MGARVAVASSDSRFVNRGFEQADRLLVFELRAGKLAFIGQRRGPSADGLEAASDGLRDCKAVLASHVGPETRTALAARGLRSFIDNAKIHAAVARLAAAGKLS